MVVAVVPVYLIVEVLVGQVPASHRIPKFDVRISVDPDALRIHVMSPGSRVVVAPAVSPTFPIVIVLTVMVPVPPVSVVTVAGVAVPLLLEKISLLNCQLLPAEVWPKF